MGGIMIKADSQSSKILKELAKRLVADVTEVKESQYEDVILSTMMDEAKTGKNASRKTIISKLKASDR
jgi:hypothetical protein